MTIIFIIDILNCIKNTAQVSPPFTRHLQS